MSSPKGEELFRKAALERLSTPDRLDQVLRLNAPQHWAALIAVLLFTAAAAVWGWYGSVETRVSGHAVILRTGGLVTVTAQGSGQILTVSVRSGDRVKANQTVARIGQPELFERIREAEDALAEARMEGRRAAGVSGESAKLRVESIERQRANLEREIAEMRERARLAAEQIPVEEQLMARGLNTKQQVIAARQKLVDIEAEIARHRATIVQLDAQKFAATAEPEQVRADSSARVTELERRLAGLRLQLTQAANVLSPHDGEVVEITAQPGASVTGGSPVLTIQPTRDRLEALVYVPADHAKQVEPGMDAQISPTTVKREEFGYMKGRIASVAGFPATHAALMRNFQNETLVRALSGDGPVTEVRAELTEDRSTPSGFKWSSSKGPPAAITAGAICNVEIVTRRQAPVTLALPALKKRLGI